MRITQGMLTNNMLRNLTNSYKKFNTYFEQLNTGKKISLPSQDPVVAMQGVNFRSQVAEIDQYKRNINEVYSWMDSSDTALDKATQTMQKLSELAVQASNDTYDELGRQSMKEEVKQLKEHLMEIANTNVNGKHIFNGTDIENAPIQTDGTGNVQLKNNSNPVEIEVSKGTKLKVNVDGSALFTETLFEDINSFIGALEENNRDEIEKSIATLNNHADNVVNMRADLGARINRLELIENRLNDQEIITKKAMSDNENIDYEEAITNLLTQESLHRAALSAGSRIIQPSLIDFLR
ncbi:flagellar hook-associated protein FlgL [Virgibacillus alimentarius]|uniref:Flagellar hook-associated protein 3 FlgL n=1 Tax=Virgibacillus alimentarius TaxID=698769 RepID=A0ABS4S8R4_9BACI|nr:MULTISPECIES: flagellar hook-associated protein FlgL [Virgibacillus]MBP2256792.1 flagellar hook-associated protein 3 FlgL [Virgibacillus alimentarius]HLR65661.1 flagellar hook-associated protein FlgL [Virgibacillus sp.]